MEARGDIAIQYGLKVFGGSSDAKYIGKFSVDYTFDDLDYVEIR